MNVALAFVRITMLPGASRVVNVGKNSCWSRTLLNDVIGLFAATVAKPRSDAGFRCSAAVVASVVFDLGHG
jgi:hypothetical protein